MTVQQGSVNWRRFAAVWVVIAALSAVYWPTWDSIIVTWFDADRATYTHGLLVAAISAWFLWRARADLTRSDPVPFTALQRAAIAIALIVLVFAWQLAYRGGIQLAHQLLLPALIEVSILALCGRFAARAAFFPVTFLYFAIPVWDLLNPLAVWSTTKCVQVMLRLFGVPAYFSGNTVHVPSGAFEIEGGCSGLHYLIVGLSLAALLGELRRDGWRIRLRWWLIALVLAAFVNWLRVFVVIVAGHLTHMQHYLVRESHYGFGWALFSIVVIVLLIVDRRIAIQKVRADACGVPVAGSPLSLRWSIAVVAALAAPLTMNAIIDLRLESASSPRWPVQPARVHECVLQSGASQWQPAQHFADHELRSRYLCDGVPVETYAAWYREQRSPKELGGYDNRLQGEAVVAAYGVEHVGERSFSSLRLQQDRGSSLLWVIYRVGEREFTSATRAQFWYALETVRTLRSPLSVAIAAYAACNPDCDAARAAFTSFTTNGGLP